ncbi:hypothetical protein B566_EDAN010363 [Ephemera danica]|nr:hypothetical protein B566_EDAN010363 [Ephemera danica]
MVIGMATSRLEGRERFAWLQQRRRLLGSPLLHSSVAFVVAECLRVRSCCSSSAMRTRKKWRMPTWLLLFVILRHSSVDAAKLNKCCDLGLALQQHVVCKADIIEEDWLPQIFALAALGGFEVARPNNVSFSYGTRPVCTNGDLPTFINSPIDGPPSFGLLYLDNSLSLLMFENSGHVFSPDTFCVDRHAALVCGAPPKPDGVRKCCGSNAAYSFNKSACVHGEHYNSDELNKVVNGHGFPMCEGNSMFVVLGELEGNVTAVVDRDNGTLQLAPPPAPPLQKDEYCLERVVERPAGVVTVIACAPPPGPERRPTWPKDFDEGSDLRFTLYPAALAISAFFLAATLATGFLLPKAHHALHWRCQTCHVACLLIGDVFLAIVQLAGPALPPAACSSIAVLMHFFFLAAFFWLNAMCFNIWWTFRDLRPMSADPGQERFRYRAYSLYAWGGPLIIAGIAVLLDTLEEEFTQGLMRPRFGERRCWFYGDWEIFVFFYGPVCALLLMNLALFAATTRELTCGLWRREGVKSASGGGGAGAHGGGTASSERTFQQCIPPGASQQQAPRLTPRAQLYSAMGVFIFVVVGCQPQVWAAVKRLWWCSRGSGPAQGSTAANPMSCSSQGAPSTIMAAEASSPPAPSPSQQQQPPPAPVVEPPLETTC